MAALSTLSVALILEREFEPQMNTDFKRFKWNSRLTLRVSLKISIIL